MMYGNIYREKENIKVDEKNQNLVFVETFFKNLIFFVYIHGFIMDYSFTD